MRPIVTDRVAWSVRLSVCHDREPCEKKAEPIEMLFGLLTEVDPTNRALDGGPDAPCEGSSVKGERDGP